MIDLNKTLSKIQSHYVKYAEAYDSDFLDIELPCRVADWVPFLLRNIEELQKENHNLKQENDTLSDHCTRLEKPTIDKILKNKDYRR